MIKELPTLGVVGAFNGVLLKERGFGEIHEVFDHLYPGIMTLGVAHMSDKAAAYLGNHVPGLRELPACDESNWRNVARLALEKFGDTIRVEGPISDINPLAVEMESFKRVRGEK